MPPPRAQTGDLWQIGGVHRLLVGDSTHAPSVDQLLGDESPLLLVTDPPYGVQYDQRWRSTNRIAPVAHDDRASWYEAYLLSRATVVYCWHASRYANVVTADFAAAGFEQRAQIIWAKPQGVFSRGHYHWQHEPCWYGVRKHRTAHWTGDRRQTTLWSHKRDPDVPGGHSTQKPIACMARPMRNHGQPGDLVYDPFLGSGTTLIAAHRENRRCYGMEIVPAYADIILARAEAEGLTCERLTRS